MIYSLALTCIELFFKKKEFKQELSGENMPKLIVYLENLKDKQL
jgi:hypothetical protein